MTVSSKTDDVVVAGGRFAGADGAGCVIGHAPVLWCGRARADDHLTAGCASILPVREVTWLVDQVS
jgi:hypothetical protein